MHYVREPFILPFIPYHSIPTYSIPIPIPYKSPVSALYTESYTELTRSKGFGIRRIIVSLLLTQLTSFYGLQVRLAGQKKNQESVCIF